MILFYTQAIQHKLATLHDEEAHHCTQVLRRRVGDQVAFTDGKGCFYEGQITHITKKECVLQIVNQWKDPHEWNFKVHIAIAPTKNIERLEWFLEKATEIGVDTITPVLCERSERKQIRLDRLEKILLAAMKQSLKATLPTLHNLMPFENFVHLPFTESQKFIAYLDDMPNPLLQQMYHKGQNTVVLIGPEGDFSEKEIQGALKEGFTGVSLGNSRLRTETAGMVACHTIQLMNHVL
jgi:16S rRNA (uracil1498-N3)-methyltransferase